MSRTAVTVYLDFRTASAIKARAERLGISQSQWLGDCARAGLEAHSAPISVRPTSNRSKNSGTGVQT